MIAPCCGKEALFLINGLCEACNALPKVKLSKDQKRTQIKQRRHEEYLRNKDAYIARAKKWAKENPEKRAEISTRYKKTHPDRVADTQRRCRLKNKGMEG